MAPLNTIEPESAQSTRRNRMSGRTVLFREPEEEDFYPATYHLESEKEIRSLWYTADEHQHMLREYKMTTEIQLLVETLQSERAHRLSNILLKAQKRSGRRSPSPTKRIKGSSPRKSNAEKSKMITGSRRRSDSAALSKLIVQLSSQRNRITHLTTSESVKNMIHTISTSNCPPNLVDEESSSSDTTHESEKSGELLRAKQKYNRLFRQLNRALAAR
ncbi:unnamed protein product [Cylindrotheca closterium]|uniref:Uncharacterized protein n=1 Tax=Cylindrotheca closterium TaxID=2856 RepID=A0AAD2JM70_9STRA|nr:unnamed protein product [Cylindrotheca closterium]